MSQNIEIGVNAKLNSQQAEAAAKKLSKTLGDVGRQKVELVPKSELRKLDEIERRWQRYLALDKKLARGMSQTGQAGLPFANVDLARAGANSVKAARINEFVNGGAMPSPTGQGFAGVAGNAAGAAAAKAAGRATGAGAGAAGGGMPAGFGAGLAGLLGGIAAFGATKLVGTISQNLEKAENLNIDYDRLKRTLGDVNVSFAGLKKAVMDTGDGLKITYGETAELASRFTKAGNLKGDDYKSLPEELGLGVGLSRAYGLDPSQGVDVLGRMRGVGASRDTQDTRRMALLIGETIAKSDAFVKSDEVMEALANYTTAQTRQSLTAANTAGYAGLFAGMVGSGIPGLDPTGAAGLLARVNSTLAAGGGKGEASQFFTSRLGAARGMDVFDTQLWREGGAFATADGVFGGNGAVAEYYRRNGLKAPRGSETLYSANLSQLKADYRDPKMLLNATANQMGVSMSSAAALHLVDPKIMGELEKALGPDGFKGINASGIGNAALAVSGTDADRKKIADGLRGRSDLKAEDRERLNRVMAGGSVQEQKEILAKLSAQYEQEKTTGTDIRESRNALDNIKTKIADTVVPALTDMRVALVHLAGGGKKSLAQMKAEVDRVEARSEYEQELAGISGERTSLAQKRRQLSADARSGKITQDEYLAGRREVEAGTAALDQRAARAKAGYDARTGSLGTGAGAGALASSFADIKDPGQRRNLATMLDVIAQSEGAGYNTLVGGRAFNNDISDLSAHPNIVGMRTKDGPSTAAGRYQITGTTWRGVAKKLGLKDFSPKSQDDAAVELLRQRGALGDVLTGDSEAAAKKLGQEWQSLPSGASPNQGKHAWETFRKQVQAAQARHGTKIPEGKSSQAPGGSETVGGGRGSAVAFDPLRVDVVHRDQSGREVRPREELQTRVCPANPDTYSSGGATGAW